MHVDHFDASGVRGEKLCLERLPMDFSIARVKSLCELDLSASFVFFAKTDEECSLVCPTERLPDEVDAVSHGWRGMRIIGQLDFGMVGVIASIAQILAQERISLFVTSTYNTDYIFLRKEACAAAEDALRREGYGIE